MADDIQSNIRINIDTASAMDSIRLLQSQISAFHQQMSKMGAASVADSRNMQQNLINSINSTGQFAANITKIKTTAEQFSYSLERNKLSMGEYFRYAGGATKTFGKLFASEFDTINKVARERVKDLQSQYIKLGRDANGAMQAIKVRPLTLDMNNLATKTQIAAQRQQLLNQLLKQGSTNLLNFGKNTQWAGRQLMVGFTIPLSIMGGAAMKAYKEIEEASLRLKRVYGDFGTTAVETEKMVKQVQSLALEYTKYGIAVKDSMEVAATAAATGKKGADLLAQIASANKLAVLGGVDQQKALQTTISLTDAFSISAKDLGKNINFLNAVENQTVLSIEDMTTAIPKAAPVIQQLGGDVKDLAFFLTAMKEGGINASEGANAIKSGLASIINPTNTASKMLQGFGINLRGIVDANKGDVKKTVVDFAQALDKLDPINRAKAIEQLFGKFQFARMSTLFKNVIEQGSQASEVLKLANQSSLELSMLAQRELSKVEQSPLYKFQKAIADFQAQLAPVGEQFMKAITPIINFGADVLKQFNGLGEGVKGFIVKFVAVAGVVGPVLLMSFGLIANAVANVIKGFALVKDIFNKTGKSSMSLGDQVNYMTQEQIQASAIASSLDQVHSKLKQTFTSEAAAVDMLTAAYERSIAVQRGFAMPVTPRGPVAPMPRKYAAGGIISGPGTGTSDSILAMVSNGEAIIPAASVARNPAMIKQLVAGNIPGFVKGTESVGKNGLPGKLLLLPGGAELSHFSEPQMVPAKDLLENAKKQGATFREIDRIMVASGGNMEKTIKAFDSRVERISRELNQMIGDVGSGKTAPKELVARDLVERGRDARSPLMEKMIRAGVSPEKAIKQVDKITSEIQSNLNRMEKGALLRAEDINKITNDAYEKIASQSPEVRAALNEQKQVSDFKDESGRRGTRGQREGFGRSSYIKQRARLGTFMEKLGFESSYGATAFKTTREMEEVSGMSGREIARTFKTLTPEQKLKVHSELKGGATAFVKALMNEAGTAVVEGVKDSTKQASPSKEAHTAGANIGKGAIQGIQSQTDDAKNAGTQVGRAAAQGISQSRRVRTQGESFTPGSMVVLDASGNPIRDSQAQTVAAVKRNSRVHAQHGYDPKTQSYFPPVVLNASDMKNAVTDPSDLMTARKLSFKERMQRLSNPGYISSKIQKTSQENLAGSIRNKSFGAAGGLALGSMFVPGEMGQIMGMASMLTSFGGMGAGGIAKGLKSMGPVLGNVIKSFTRLVPLVGAAVIAYEVFDNFIVPMIRKNADAYMAIADTLNITKERIDGINNFFGTELQLTGVRALQISSGSQTQKEASIAKQFQESQEFKDTYQQSAQKLQGLSDQEFKQAIQFMATDLFGQGMAKEQVTAIVDAIALEAKKSRVSIAPELFSLENKETRALMDKNIKTVISTMSEIYERNKNYGTMSPEDSARIKASTAQVSSYMSSLSGQLENGAISGEQFNIQYEKLLSMTRSSVNPNGINALRAAFINLNSEMGNSMVILNELQFGIVSKAILSGVTPTAESKKVFDFGTEGQISAQVKLYEIAGKKQLELNKKIRETKNQLSAVQESNQENVNLEEKINEKYDRRISQIEKIKKLNEQISKSQEGQLTLAEALNKGDIAAAARAAIDIQNNDIQASLDNQKTGLDEARQAEIKPLKDNTESNTTAVNNLTTKLETLITKGITVKNLPEDVLDTIMSPEEKLKADGVPEWLIPMVRFFNPGAGKTSKNSNGGEGIATGGHITGPGTGTSDDIPAMLSNGEYVIRANAVKTIGVDTLNKLNQADRVGFAAGGMVNSFRNKPKPPRIDQQPNVDPLDPKSVKAYKERVLNLFKPTTRKDDPTWWDWTGGKQELFNDTAKYPGYYQWTAPSAVGGSLNKDKTRGSYYDWSDSPFQLYNPLNNKKTNKTLFENNGTAFPNPNANQNPLDIIEAYKKILEGRKRLAENVYLPDLNKDITLTTSKNPVLYTIATYAKAFSNKGIYTNSTGGQDLEKAKALIQLGKVSKMIPGWDGLDPKEFRNLVNAMHSEFGPQATSTMIAKLGFGKRYDTLMNPPKGPSAKLNYAENYLGISGGIPKNSPIYEYAYNYMTNEREGNKRGRLDWFDESPNSFVMNPNLGTYNRLGFANGGMVGYKDGGKPKPPKPPKFGIEEMAAGLSNPMIQGGAYGSDVSSGFDLAKSYKNIFTGQGDFWDYFSGILAPFALSGFGSGASKLGMLTRAGKDVAKTKIATMNAKKILAMQGGKEAGKLTPQISAKMTAAGLEKFISENKYKTIFDNVRSTAKDSIDERTLIEAATGMNKALKLKPGQSPAYGFLGTKEPVPYYHGSIYGNRSGQSPEQLKTDLFNQLINPYSRPLQSYGSTVVNLKPSALRNATVSFGDSLSIYQQAVKAGVKTPQVMKLGSLLTTLRMSSMARKTKGILGSEFSMPYAEVHMPSGFGLDDVSGIGVSNEFVDRVPEAISSIQGLLAKAGKSDIPVHDIIGRGKNAFEKFGTNISKAFPKGFIEKLVPSTVNARVLPPESKKFKGVVAGEEIMAAMMGEFDELFPMFAGTRVPAFGRIDFPNGQMPADFFQYLKLKSEDGYDYVKNLDAKQMWDYLNERMQLKVYNQLQKTNPQAIKNMSFEQYLTQMKSKEVGTSGDATIAENNILDSANLPKLANEAFIKSIMGIDNPKDYLYQIYRNTRGKPDGIEDAESLSGYHSLDSRMAHGFHASGSGDALSRSGSSIVGQYELDDLYGQFGTSSKQNLIDEFPILVGPKATQKALDRNTMTVDSKKLMPPIPPWLNINPKGNSGTGPFRNFAELNRFNLNAVDALPASTWEELKAALGITGEDFANMYKKLFPRNNMPTRDGGDISSLIIKRVLDSIVPLDEFGMTGKVGFNYNNIPNTLDKQEGIRQLMALQKFLPEKLITDRFFPNKYANGGLVSAKMSVAEPIPKQFANGGMVPSYFAQGGFSMGTDTVPAMLTPGEFVIKKSAVDRIGASTLNKINGYAEGGLVGGMSTDTANSVYNNTYEVNVNVASMSNPNDIANAVMRQIKQVDNTRVRGLSR